MNCPDCGSSITPDQRFCRACGADLDGAAIVTNPRLRLFRIGLAAMFLGLLVALTGSIILQMDTVKFAGLVGMISGIFLIAYASVGPSRSSIKMARPKSQAALPKAETTKKLDPMDARDFVPSVTERTTNLLETPVSNRKETL